MRDPVTGFTYPAAWVGKAQPHGHLGLVERGLAVLTSDGTILRRGFTTGTTAAAACKAAVLSLAGPVEGVTLGLPCGISMQVPVLAKDGRASVRKDAGDYTSDVTNGLECVATAVPVPDGVQLVPGTGIGTFARDTPRYGRGTPAISHAALAYILKAMEEAIEETGIPGAAVTLEIPEGARVARKTLNPRVGVEGGISILGTTGLVEPWDDHLAESMAERVAAAKNPVLTTGRIGLRYARMLFPGRDVILVGGKIGMALDAAKGGCILFGLPGLIVKHINPKILDGTGYMTVEEYSASPEFQKAVKASIRDFGSRRPGVRVVLVNRDGSLLGEGL